MTGNAASALESVGVTYQQILRLKHSVPHDLMELIMENVDKLVQQIASNDISFNQFMDLAVQAPEKVHEFFR